MMSNITYLPKIILSKPRMDLKGHRLTCAFILVVLIIMIFLRLLLSNAFLSDASVWRHAAALFLH